MSPASAREKAAAREVARRLRVPALIVLALLLAGAAFVFVTGWPKALSLQAIVAHREAVRAAVAGDPVVAIAVFVAIYAVAAGSSLPGVVFLTIGGGAVFGGLLGGFAAVAGATAGATGMFLLARSAFGAWLARRAGPVAQHLAEGFREDAFNYLLFMRLVPIFPFLVTNVVPALCGVRLSTFVAATAIGVVPVTLAFAFFGAGLDSVLAAEAAQYRDCVSAGKAACRLGFEVSDVLTPDFIAGLIALGAAALVPVAVRRWKSPSDRRA